MKYGIIENGYLKTKEVEEYTEQYKDGIILKYRLVTIAEQIDTLSENGWKPVDEIEYSKTICEEGFICRIIPFDAGNRISFRYEKIKDIQKIRNQIKNLKEELSSSDYKITKCYEASLLGYTLPYDVTELHQQRQKLRDEINQMEQNL